MAKTKSKKKKRKGRDDRCSAFVWLQMLCSSLQGIGIYFICYIVLTKKCLLWEKHHQVAKMIERSFVLSYAATFLYEQQELKSYDYEDINPKLKCRNMVVYMPSQHNQIVKFYKMRLRFLSFAYLERGSVDVLFSYGCQGGINLN